MRRLKTNLSYFTLKIFFLAFNCAFDSSVFFKDFIYFNVLRELSISLEFNISASHRQNSETKKIIKNLPFI